MTRTYAGEERGKVQALNDFLIFGTVALSSDTAQTATTGSVPLSSFNNTPIDVIQPKGPTVELLDETNPLDRTGDAFSATWERSGRRLPV